METLQQRRVVEKDGSTRQRIVVKLGSSTVCDEAGAVRTDLLRSFAAQSLDLRERGVDTIFVSSGAVAVGQLVAPNITDRKLAAVVGQSWLNMAWVRSFYPTPVAPHVFTDEQLSDRGFVRSAIESTLREGAIPLINCANPDTNNDFTGRQVARATDADILAMLTTADGVLHDGRTIPHVSSRSDLDGVAFGNASTLGTGGMGEKTDHAWGFVAETGREAVIAHGFTDAVLHKIAGGERIGTRFAHI